MSKRERGEGESEREGGRERERAWRACALENNRTASKRTRAVCVFDAFFERDTSHETNSDLSMHTAE